MAQYKENDLTDVIGKLTETEEQELAKLLQNPVIVKYLRIMGMTAIFEQAAYPYDKLADLNGNVKLLLELAYQKGIMHMANTLLNFTHKEKSDGPAS